MKIFVTCSIVSFPAETVIGLNADQARRRKHALVTIKPAGDKRRGIYRTTQVIQFRVGETIELENDPPRALVNEVVDPKEAERRARASAAADKPGKLGKKAMQELRDQIEAEIRPAIAADVYAKLLAILPPELKAGVEAAVVAAGNAEG